MVDLVAFLQAAQDGDGRLDRRFVDQHLLESPLERGVLFDVFAVFVERGRADAMQLAAGERGLQHVAGIDRAFRLAGADHGMQFVDENDRPALVGGDILEHCLQPLLELAAILGTREEHRHVEREHALVLERFGDFAVDDALRKALDDRSLAHARLADQHGVVLGAPLQDLDGAADLVVAPDDRIELALTRALGEVDGVLLQRLALAFGFLRIDPGAAAHGLDRLLQRLARQAIFLGKTAGLALVVGEREQEQFAGDELVAALGRFLVGEVEKVVEIARDRNLAALSLDLGQAADRLGERGFECRNVDAGAREQRRAAAVFLLQQRGE